MHCHVLDDCLSYLMIPRNNDVAHNAMPATVHFLASTGRRPTSPSQATCSTGKNIVSEQLLITVTTRNSKFFS